MISGPTQSRLQTGHSPALLGKRYLVMVAEQRGGGTGPPRSYRTEPYSRTPSPEKYLGPTSVGMDRLSTMQMQIDEIVQSQTLLSEMHQTLLDGTSSMTTSLREKLEVVEVQEKATDLTVMEHEKNIQTYNRRVEEVDPRLAKLGARR